MTASVDALLAAVTPKTRVVFLANPNNPTGTLLSTDDIADLERRLPDHVLLVLDAAYAEFVGVDDYDDGLAVARASERTVVLHTFSKIYGLAGLRVGWAYGPEAVIDMINRIRLPNSLTRPSLAAAVAALADKEHVGTYRELNARLHDRFMAAASNMHVDAVPSPRQLCAGPVSRRVGACRSSLSRHETERCDVAADGGLRPGGLSAHHVGCGSGS